MGVLDTVKERLQGLLGDAKGTAKGKSKSGDGKSDEVKAAVKDAGEIGADPVPPGDCPKPTSKRNDDRSRPSWPSRAARDTGSP